MKSVLNLGFVELIDKMGDDKRVCHAARVSNDLADMVSDLVKDNNLIEFLMREKHTSPFEHVQFTFRIKMPIFVHRQHVRHRTAKMNEISGRYTKMKNEVFVPREFHEKPDTRTQGRSELVHKKSQHFGDRLVDLYDKMFNLYDDMVDSGVALEEAREHLPLSLYTEFFWTIDLHNLFHYLSLRLASDAQKEIQEYAKAILTMIEPHVPLSVASWKKFQFQAITLTADEFDYLVFKKSVLNDRDSKTLSAKLGKFNKRLEM